jgi:hypothetical protein
MMLPFETQQVRNLFQDELFCYFYSLFKLFIDQLMKDYRQNLHYFAQNIYSQAFLGFDKSSFTSSHPLKIPVKSDKAQYERFLKEKHNNTYFRLITLTKYLLENCWKKINQQQFQKLAYESVSNTLKHLFECAQFFQNSFDSSLFIIKNLVELYNFLQNNLDTTETLIKLNEMNFSPKNDSLTSLFKGKIDLETLSGVFYELMPKMTEYSIDLKANICKAIDLIFEKNLEIFSVLVCKSLVEYMNRVRTIQSKRESWEAILKTVDPADKGQVGRVEGSLKELEEGYGSLMGAETIKQVYQSFASTIGEIFEMMVDKLNCYADQNTQAIFKDKFLPYLVDSTMNLLHSFYIEVSKNYRSNFYDEFMFKDTSKWREDLISLIQINLTQASSPN